MALDVADGLGAAPATLIADVATVIVPVGLGCAALVPFLAPAFLPFTLSGGAPVAGSGHAGFSFLIPPSFPSGTLVAIQIGIADAASPFGFSATNGLALIIQ